MASKATEQVNDTLQMAVKKAQTRKHELKEMYTNGPQVEVSGSPFYKPYFGGNMPINLNGIAVYVPLDGRPHKIPAAFADIFNERIARVDATISKMGVLGANIEESYAGEVDIEVL